MNKSKERFEKIQNEKIGVASVHKDIVCIGCMFSRGDTPFDDTPYKAHCAIYTREKGKLKPNEVYFDGKPCKYRRDK